MVYKNNEGYVDPTAGVAMGHVKKEEQDVEKLNHKIIQSFRLLVDLAGFEIVGRVTLKHKKSGRVFKWWKHISVADAHICMIVMNTVCALLVLTQDQNTVKKVMRQSAGRILNNCLITKYGMNSFHGKDNQL